MIRNALTSEIELKANLAQEPQTLGDESLASGPETTRPEVDSIIRQVRQDASRDAVKYLLRSDVGHDGE
jgi:hypothetical protein